jgi:hypothetical protein
MNAGRRARREVLDERDAADLPPGGAEQEAVAAQASASAS